MHHAFVNADSDMDVLADPVFLDNLPRLASLDLHATLCDVLGDYRPGSLISTGTLSERVRSRLPLLEISDADLSNAIAEQALNTGHSILFEAAQ